MPLIVEDGTGLANADAFVSVTDCNTYAAAYGLSDWTSAAASPASVKEGAIRRATQYLSTMLWSGERLKGRDQALAWPRTGATDGEGWDVAEDAVPTEVVQACCELAAFEAATPGGLSPAVTITDRVKREKVGPLETEYVTPPTTADAARPILTKVNDLIGGLLDGFGGSLFAEAVRR